MDTRACVLRFVSGVSPEGFIGEPTVDKTARWGNEGEGGDRGGRLREPDVLGRWVQLVMGFVSLGPQCVTVQCEKTQVAVSHRSRSALLGTRTEQLGGSEIKVHAFTPASAGHLWILHITRASLIYLCILMFFILQKLCMNIRTIRALSAFFFFCQATYPNTCSAAFFRKRDFLCFVFLSISM